MNEVGARCVFFFFQLQVTSQMQNKKDICKRSCARSQKLICQGAELLHEQDVLMGVWKLLQKFSQESMLLGRRMPLQVIWPYDHQS